MPKRKRNYYAIHFVAFLLRSFYQVLILGNGMKNVLWEILDK